MTIAGIRSQSSDGSWYCTVAVAAVLAHHSGPAPKLLMHWSVTDRAGGKWQAPPSGWNTNPPISHDAGKDSKIDQFGRFLETKNGLLHRPDLGTLLSQKNNCLLMVQGILALGVWRWVSLLECLTSSSPVTD